MSKPNPICVDCRSEMKCSKNEFLVNDEEFDEYRATYWFGDKFTCQHCGSGVVVGFGASVTASQCDPAASVEFTR
jgi:hypothetical protein